MIRANATAFFFRALSGAAKRAFVPRKFGRKKIRPKMRAELRRECPRRSPDSSEAFYGFVAGGVDREYRGESGDLEHLLDVLAEPREGDFAGDLFELRVLLMYSRSRQSTRIFVQFSSKSLLKAFSRSAVVVTLSLPLRAIIDTSLLFSSVISILGCRGL